MALVSLPDDLLREILVRLEELPVLFRCAMACKRLCLLIADPTFFRQRCPNQEGCHPSFSFVGFIAKDKRIARRDGVNGLVIPAPRSGLGPGCRDLGSFMAGATHARHLDGAVPLASRGGLLLLRLADLDRTVVHMAVCNLLAGTCQYLLPPLKLRSAYDDYEWCAYAVLTGVDCRHTSDEQRHSNSMFFKVVVIGSDENTTRYSLYTFASHEVSWRTRVNCLSIGERTHGSFSDVMVRHGMAHWLSSGPGRFYDLITFNIQSGQISCKEIHIPPDYNRVGRPCLTLDIDETLSLLWMHCPGPKLEILVQQPEQQNVGGNSEWLRTGMIELNQPEDKKTQPRWLCMLGEKYGTILVKDGGQNVYTVEVKTGTIEEVKEWPRRCDIIPWEPIPFEMDWSAFFISRLGTRSRKGGSKSVDHHGKASKEAV